MSDGEVNGTVSKLSCCLEMALGTNGATATICKQSQSELPRKRPVLIEGTHRTKGPGEILVRFRLSSNACACEGTRPGGYGAALVVSPPSQLRKV